MNAKELLLEGKATLGIEFGSTRIKAVLIAPDGDVLATGGYTWENRYVGGVWTYDMADVWTGLADCYADLTVNVRKQYGVRLTRLASIGVSAMMHGYLPFDGENRQLAAFRTWRNLMTGDAARELTELFHFNIPQRWSIAHLYQAIRNGEAHVAEIRHLSTLAGYVHFMLTGEWAVGVGEASGMFPIDGDRFDPRMLEAFDELIAQRGYPWRLADILPRVCLAGEEAGCLTKAGARLLDPLGELEPGVPCCAPEGDAQTGMVATNSVAARTGNVSAGTSVFAMIVMERPFTRPIPELEVITTPTGKPVAMVHCNNCTTDLNAWVGLFGEVAELFGTKPDAGELFTKLLQRAMEGDPDAGALLAYNYDGGENIMDLTEGRPLFVRRADSRFNLANFMRAQLYSTLATLKVGLDLMFGEGDLKVDRIYAHGGLFKTRGVAQSALVSAMGAPVTVLETANEGGAWGIALLAAYMAHKTQCTLEQWLDAEVFAGTQGSTMQPEPRLTEGFAAFQRRYVKGVAIERAAVEAFTD